AIETPVDDISTIHVNAVRPNQGAINVIATRNMIATYGVLYLLCSLLNTEGIIPERPIENNRRLELIKNPFKPVKIPMIIAIAKIAKPIQPNAPLVTAPVNHNCPFKLVSELLSQPVYKIINTYVNAAANKLYTISLNVLFGEKSNSSAVCGILSKPT